MKALLILITVSFSGQPLYNPHRRKLPSQRVQLKPRRQWAASLWERSKARRFGPETAPTLRDLEETNLRLEPRLRPKATRYRLLSQRPAPSHPIETSIAG